MTTVPYYFRQKSHKDYYLSPIPLFSLLTYQILSLSLVLSPLSLASAEEPLDTPRTTPADISVLTQTASQIPELKRMIAQNRKRALWLINSNKGRLYSVDFLDQPGKPPTIRFNPRRCMRVITDTLVAARFGEVETREPSLSVETIASLKKRGADELRKATAQALSEPSPRWPWHAPMNPRTPDLGTLEAAEATACLALGYDWLRNSNLLSDLELTQSRAAIIKGLTRLRDYGRLRFRPEQCEDSCQQTGQCSVSCWSNWNAVLNGTAILAAVAVEPDVTGIERAILIEAKQTALRALPTYFRLFSNDATDSDRKGAYPEGPTYLNFSLEYLALADTALRTSTDTQPGFDLTSTGVLESGSFALDILSPFSPAVSGTKRKSHGLSVNFSDGSSTVLPSISVLSWLGKFHNRTDMAAAAQHLATAQLTQTIIQHPSAYTMNALAILWFDPSDSSEIPERRTRIYGSLDGSNNMAFLHRKAANGKKLFAFLKGGKPSSTPHGHMDSGSFILEANDRRWAFDLSHESYRAPNYFVLNGDTYPNRWSYLRANNFGHNTLSIGNSLQNADAATEIYLARQNTETETAAVANLTNAYAGSASSVRRRLAIHQEGKFIVKDVIEGVPLGTPISWQMIYCRNTNTGLGRCYEDDGRNPILVNPSNSKLARIQEEVASSLCPAPRFLDAKILTPGALSFSSDRLVAPDIQYQDPTDGSNKTYQQADNASAGKCYSLSVTTTAEQQNTTIEIELTPGQTN